MKTLTRILAIAVLCLAVPAASGEAPETTGVTLPEIAAQPAPAETAPEAEAAVVVDPAADAQPAQYPGWQDEYGDCIIYCDGQPYPLDFMTYDQCCGGGHLCPDGNFPSGGNTYWSPYVGWPLLCMN